MGKDLKGKELGKGIGQSPDKRYYARYTDRHGKRSKPFYSFDLKEVKEWLLKQKYDDKLGNTTIIHENMTVREAYKLWYKKKKKDVRPQTLAQIRVRYDSHIKKYELYDLKNINKDFVEDFMLELVDKNMSYGYTNEIRSDFSQIIEFAIDKGYCTRNPFLHYKYPKEFRDKNNRHQQELRMTKFLTAQQQQLFLDYINKVKRCHYRNLYKFLLYTGLRISEALALKWEHIDFTKKCIYVTDNHVSYKDENNVLHTTYNAPTKSFSSTAILPLTEQAFSVLLNIQHSTPNEKQKGLVFLTTKGTPINCGTIRCMLAQVIGTINKRVDISEQLPLASPHYFRHTCAENLIEQGVHLTGVQYLMRHAQLTTTANTYGHTSYSIAKEAVDKYNQNSNVT